MNRGLDRAMFLRLSASIISGLNIPGSPMDSGQAGGAEPGFVTGMDDAWLIRGLTGMARARTWFDAHWGAGIIAGYYLCRDNHLGEQTVQAVERQMDTVVRLHADRFAPLPAEPADDRRIEDVLQALRPALQGGLRAHGHAVIFASLSVRALRDVPHMVQPAIISALCDLSRQIARIPPQKPPTRTARYDSTQGMIDATFDSLTRFQGLLGRPSIRRPNFTHMITHTEALMNLELMGYPELAKAGHAGHQAHIAAPVPKFDAATTASTDRASLDAVMGTGYWTDSRNQEIWSQKWSENDNPNGDWVAVGHLFKVLYSYHRLAEKVKDQDKRQLCSRILLERYLNPAVSGG